MNRWLCALALGLPLWAGAVAKLPLDEVIYQASVENWVTTTSAEVTINIDASLDKSGLSEMRQTIMSNCKKIADADWHITQFYRSQDASGLERVSVTAQARVPEDKLAGVRDQAKSVSRPGATYTINNIDFVPTLDEIQKVKTALREQLYQKVNDEIARLNKTFPQQQYTAHKIDFLGVLATPEPMQQNRAMMVKADGGGSSLVVANKVTMNVTVVIAATRDKGKA